jgi:hypothetical protein
MRRERAAELIELLEQGPMPFPQIRPRGPILSDEVVQFARITLPREAKLYFTAGARAARKNKSLGRLHQFRLHGKSLRYSLELFEPLYGSKIHKLQQMLKRSQNVLGDMADARAGLKLLKQLNAPSDVLGPIREIAEKKREEFLARWSEDVPDEKPAAQWVEYLRRYAKVRS